SSGRRCFRNTSRCMETKFMSTSPEMLFLSKLSEGEDIRIPEELCAYFEQRALNQVYDYVMSRFEYERESSGLNKAKLARRIGRGQDQVNRLLASPGNWTIATAARLLLGIGGEEPIFASKKLLGRKPRNSSVLALLEDATNPDSTQPARS